MSELQFSASFSFLLILLGQAHVWSVICSTTQWQCEVCARVFCDKERVTGGNGPLWGQGPDWSALALAGLWLADPMLHCDTKGRRNPYVFGDNNDFTSTRVACHICQELMRSEWAIMQLNTQRMSHGNDSLQTGRWGLGIKNCPRLLLAAHAYF